MASKELTVIFDRVTEPKQNLAREEAVFGMVERREMPEILRLWRNNECLIRGRARNPRYGWYDEALAAEMRVPVYERSTGGGVVYEDLGNMNWSFFLRASGSFVSPTALFDRASAPVIRSLKHLGFDASFARPNRIEVSGRKVSGMAARSTRRAHLVHGTLLVDSDLGRLNSLCVPPPSCPPVSNLTEWSEMVEMEGVEKELVQTLRSEYAVRIGDEPKVE